MKRWLRRALRRCGIDVRFSAVVCPHQAKTIRSIDDGRVEVIDRRSLVFLELPGPGDLRDRVPLCGDGAGPYLSPDAFDVGRKATRTGTVIYWKPRQPIVRYAAYSHQHGWIARGGERDAVLCTEFRCELRTGIVDLDLIAPGRFEAGVAFKRPRWRRLGSQRRLIKYALRQLESQAERPAIVEEGARIHWKLVAPRKGDRYVCVAFHENGIDQWRKRLEAQSFAGRMRRLFRPLASSHL